MGNDSYGRLVDKYNALQDQYSELRKAVGALVFRQIGPDTELGWIAKQDAKSMGHNPWDAEAYVAKGWERNFGDGAVRSPYFEVLRKPVRSGSAGEYEYLILCPTFLRRPLLISHGVAY